MKKFTPKKKFGPHKAARPQKPEISDRESLAKSPAQPGPEQRLNKLLASAGLGARRQVDDLIEQGRVEIDGEVVTRMGTKVDPETSRVTVDGVALKKMKPTYFALHKPAGILCTNRDPQGRKRAIDFVPNQDRLFPVGRLDASSVGLLLLTNDGELAQQLTHPKYGVPKTYFVEVAGHIEADQLARLRKGIYLSDGVARVDFVKIKKVRKASTELEITLSEGKNREIRRVLARLGHKVVLLKRLSIGSLKLGNLPSGSYRPVMREEIQQLYRAVDEAKKAKKERRTMNDRRSNEVAQAIQDRRKLRAETNPTASEPSDQEIPQKKSETRFPKKPANKKSLPPAQPVVQTNSNKDPFDWDDDDLMVASPFSADYQSTNDSSPDDEDDSWVKPRLASQTDHDDDDQYLPTKLSGLIDDEAVELHESISSRVGNVIDYEESDSTESPQNEDHSSSEERHSRPKQGRTIRQNVKKNRSEESLVRGDTRRKPRGESNSSNRNASSAPGKKPYGKTSKRTSKKGSKPAYAVDSANSRLGRSGKRVTKKSFPKASVKRGSRSRSERKRGK